MAAMALAIALGAAGCRESDEVIADRMISIPDVAGRLFILESDRHKVEVAASNDAVTVTFVGPSCPGVEREIQTFSTICKLSRSGQIALSNPTFLGTGAGTTAMVTVTRRARE